MRLNRWTDNNRFPEPEHESVERVELLLRQAADFDPGMTPANDFIATAIGRQTNCRAVRLRPLMLGMAGAAGMAVAALILLFMPRGEIAQQMAQREAPILTLHNSGSRVTEGGNKAAQENSGPAQRSEIRSGTKRAPESENNTDGASAYHRQPRIQTAGEEISRPFLHPHPRSQRFEEAVPRVRWHDEVVQRYDRGVITPAYVVEEQGRNGEVVYRSVMMPVSTETGARPVLIDGAPDTTISLTSNSEEAPHK